MISTQITAGFPFAKRALKVLEPYAGKLARTVLRGRKLPGANIKKHYYDKKNIRKTNKHETINNYNSDCTPSVMYNGN